MKVNVKMEDNWIYSNSQINMKTILITGSTSGIGKALVYHLMDDQFDLILVGRNQLLLDELEKFVKKEVPKRRIFTYLMDFGKLEDVYQVSNVIKKNHPQIDYLYHNAGAVPQTKNAWTKDGHLEALQINYLSMLLMNEILLENVLNSSEKTILHTTSMSASKKFYIDEISMMSQYGRIKIYGVSKLFSRLYFHHLATIHNELKIKLINPGIVFTNQIRQMIPKPLRFLEGGVRLFIKDPNQVAGQIKSIIKKNQEIPIELYKGKKIERHAKINLDQDLQKEVMIYSMDLLKGYSL